MLTRNKAVKTSMISTLALVISSAITKPEINNMRLGLLVSPVIVPILRYNDISLTYFEVFEGLAMSPEEGKCIEVDVPFDSQMFNFPEEGLKKVFTLRFTIFAQCHCKIRKTLKKW